MSHPRPTSAWIQGVRARNRRELGLHGARSQPTTGWGFVLVLGAVGALVGLLTRPRGRRRRRR